MIRYVFYLTLSVAVATAQDSAPPPPPQTPPQATDNPQLSRSYIAQLQAKADAGDPAAQSKLGKAYKDGNGVPQNDTSALKWFRKAAEQGDASAENNIGIMYRMGQGVTQDKEEAIRCYHKGAKHGSALAMFNLGVSYYNGKGVVSSEPSAYAWFLLAKEAGDAAADEAVRRSAAALSPKEMADALAQIAAMYAGGEELPKNDSESLRWLRKAADIDSRAKLRLALHFLTGPESQHDYKQALELCQQASKDWAPASSCVGYIYRQGLGVTKNPTEALKWYQKGVAAHDSSAMLDLAEMYLTGEGTKANRVDAFMLLLLAARLDVSGAKERARNVLDQLDPAEITEVKKRIHGQGLDPERVFAAVRGVPISAH